MTIAIITTHVARFRTNKSHIFFNYIIYIAILRAIAVIRAFSDVIRISNIKYNILYNIPCCIRHIRRCFIGPDGTITVYCKYR